VATADSVIGPLAGAIAAHVRDSGRVTVRSVGPKAAYRAIKALVSACEYLQSDAGSSPERPLVVQFAEEVSEQEVASPRDGAPAAAEQKAPPKRTVLLAAASVAEGPLLPPGAGGDASERRELTVSARTNAGKAAAAIAATMRTGPGAIATVRAMGADAVHQSLIAASMAQRYLDNDGRGVAFVVAPAFEVQSNLVRPGDAADRRPPKQLVLRAHRVH